MKKKIVLIALVVVILLVGIMLRNNSFKVQVEMNSGEITYPEQTDAQKLSTTTEMTNIRSLPHTLSGFDSRVPTGMKFYRAVIILYFDNPDVGTSYASYNPEFILTRNMLKDNKKLTKIKINIYYYNDEVLGTWDPPIIVGENFSTDFTVEEEKSNLLKTALQFIEITDVDQNMKAYFEPWRGHLQGYYASPALTTADKLLGVDGEKNRVTAEFLTDLGLVETNEVVVYSLMKSGPSHTTEQKVHLDSVWSVDFSDRTTHIKHVIKDFVHLDDIIPGSPFIYFRGPGLQHLFEESATLFDSIVVSDDRDLYYLSTELSAGLMIGFVAEFNLWGELLYYNIIVYKKTT